MLGVVAVLIGIAGVFVALGIPLFVESKKRPALRIERADDANAHDRTPPFRIVHIKVINEPLSGRLGRWLLRNVATSCKVDITFRSRSGNGTVAIPGRWSGAPEPFSYVPTSGGGTGVLFDPTKLPQSTRFDLSPDTDGEVLGIAIKTDGDPEAYAFTSESYRARDTRRLPELKLPDEEYDVVVTARAGGLRTTETFTLRNRGTAFTGLQLGRPH